MNALNALGTLVNAVEKLYLLPPSEITGNGKMVAEIQNAFSAQNIDGIINGLKNELAETRNQQYSAQPSMSQESLLHAYAQRETDRMMNAKGKAYTTTIINAGETLENVAANASADAEKKFETVFNSVYADGAVKINTTTDPSRLLSYIDYTPYRLNFMEYLSIPTLSEMVDRPIAIALKKFPKVNTHNDKFNEAIEAFIHKKKIHSVIKDAIFYSLLSPRGSLVVPIKRGKTVTFNAFNDTQFAYGTGASYSGVTQPYSPMKVGDIYCMGAKLRHGVSAFFTCPGYEPLFGIGLNRIPQLRTAAEAWNLYIHILKILMVRSQVIVQKMEGDIQTDTMLSQMRSSLQRLSQSMGVSTPIEQTRGMALDILNNNISPGTADIATVFKDFVASVTGIAPEYFFGGGNAAYSQAAFQIHTTNENVRSRYQHGEIEPLLRFIVNTAIQYDDALAQFGIDEDDFKIDFENIYDETEQEAAELKKTKTEVLIRQASYPELEKAFKQEGLLADDITLPVVEEPKDDGDIAGGSGGAKSSLTKPLA